MHKMATNLKHCLMLLQDNEESVKKDALQLLLKLCNNIVKHPQEMRYRKIQLANTLVSTKLLPAAGAIECLFEAGFIENDDEFLLPINAPLTGVIELQKYLNDIMQKASTQSVPCTSSNIAKPSTSTKNPLIQEKEYQKSNFLQQLVFWFQGVLRYENQDLQMKVKSILPLEKLQISAMEKLRDIQRQMKSNSTFENIVFEDVLLSELLSWFKFKFFEWVDSPSCAKCTNECSFNRTIPSSNQKISRTEIHRCKTCGYDNEFVRYTDPETLLYTRKGRCGEWANCFTLICRSVGFDARLVYDYTDHIWTEVWSVAHNRWIHADACENAMDRPLIYEKGWGKKLSYIIAFSKDEIQDVTWRYTRNYSEVMKRRKLCSEEAFTLFLNKLNVTRQNSDGYSQVRKKFVIKRSVFELAEMITAPPGSKKPSELAEDQNNYAGRTSGSIAWRISRGEAGDIKASSTQWKIPKQVSSYEFIYSIINDTYTTKDIINNKILDTKKNWQNGVECLENMFRKEEQDWKMIYLARSPDSTSGKITWTFIVEDNENMYIDSIKLQANTMTINGAAIKWEIKGIIYSKDKIKETKIVPILNCQNFETKDLKGAIEISISATLSGGEGEVAWQHAQLFRESLNANSKIPSMLIKIDLLNKF